MGSQHQGNGGHGEDQGGDPTGRGKGLIHGVEDSIVKVDESRKARDAYTKWGHDVNYVEVAGLNHFWAHKARINDKIWTFFASHALDD